MSQPSYQIHGRIESIADPEKISETFSKRNFVVITNENTPHPTPLIFELHNDRTDIIDAYNEGDEVSVDFQLRGRQWVKDNKKNTMNTLLAWKIQPINKR